MDHNLIPPFIMRETGVEVNKILKIQVNDLTDKDHSLYLTHHKLRVSLAPWGMFLYFLVSRRSTNAELEECDVLLMTPDGPWNPYSDVYARNKKNMMDWDGNMVEPTKDRMRILLADIEEDVVTVAAAHISTAETKRINDNAASADTLAEVPTRPTFDKIPVELNEVAAVLSNILSVLDPVSLANSLSERGELGRFCCAK